MVALYFPVFYKMILRKNPGITRKNISLHLISIFMYVNRFLQDSKNCHISALQKSLSEFLLKNYCFLFCINNELIPAYNRVTFV